MMRWLFKRNRGKPDKGASPANDPEADLLRGIDARIRRIEEILPGLAKHPQITIENLHIHQPVLERLEFRLDRLDIEELSGSLNLGNNFGAKGAAGGSTKPEREGKPANARQTAPDKSAERSASDASGAKPGLHSTKTGFTFKPDKHD